MLFAPAKVEDNGCMTMRPLVLLFSLAFIVSIDIRILAPVLPSISLSLGSSPGSVGLAMTTYAIAYGVGQLLYGPLSDRLGRIVVVRAAGVGFTLCTILSALSLTTWQFIGARLLAGAFAGAVIPLTLVFVGDTVEYGRRQAALGRLSAITSSAMALSAAIGGAVSYYISWRFMLLGYGLLALIPIGLMWRIQVQALSENTGVTERYADLLMNRRALFVYANVFMEGFFIWGVMTYLGSFATHRYGLDQLAVGFLLALFGIGTMAGGLLIGRVRRRLSENALAKLGGVLMGVCLLVLIPRWSLPVFASAMLGLGLGFACLHTTLQLRGTEISSAARGKAFSLFIFFLFLGVSSGSAVLGRFVDAGLDELMLAVAGVGLIVVGVATAFTPQDQKNGRLFVVTN
jgi:predicted MFS family arabinose efflux permease